MTVFMQESQAAHLKRTPHGKTPTDQPHISASQLRSYSGCPLAWRLSRTHRPDHVSAALVFGSAFHAAAEKLYQRRLEGKSVNHQELMEQYEAVWATHLEPKQGEPPISSSLR